MGARDRRIASLEARTPNGPEYDAHLIIHPDSQTREEVIAEHEAKHGKKLDPERVFWIELVAMESNDGRAVESCEQ